LPELAKLERRTVLGLVGVGVFVGLGYLASGSRVEAKDQRKTPGQQSAPAGTAPLQKETALDVARRLGNPEVVSGLGASQSVFGKV
jgi:hypothetical protein